MTERTCPHCGESHGPTQCRQELALRLAEEINERQEAAKDRGSLWVQVAELNNRVHSLEAEVKQL